MRKIIIKITISIALIVIFFILLLEVLYYFKRPKSEFTNYSEAKASGLMDKGWVPPFMPKSSIDIKEQHDIDTNWVKMTFKYNAGDIADTRKSCNSEVKIENGIQFTCKYFTNNVTIKLFHDGNAELYGSPH